MKLKLTVTDTPGFGDQINNDKWWVLRGAGEGPAHPPLGSGKHPGLGQPGCFEAQFIHLYNGCVQPSLQE